MTITFHKGNILTSSCTVLVNPCNCKSVSGAGLSKAIMLAYPEVESIYKERCADGTIRIGNLHLIQRSTHPSILNFPTKDEWRNPSQYSYIEAGLDRFIAIAPKLIERNLNSIAFPPLGCGNGNLDWPTVYRLMMHKFKALEHLNQHLHIQIWQPSYVLTAQELHLIPQMLDAEFKKWQEAGVSRNTIGAWMADPLTTQASLEYQKDLLDSVAQRLANTSLFPS